MTLFWLNDPLVLFNKNEITELWPKKDLNLEKKLNAITRVVILVTLIGYIMTKSVKILVSAGVTLVILAIIYKTQKKKNVLKENLDNINNIIIKEDANTIPTQSNPLMNVMPTDYKNPQRNKAALSYDKSIDKEILKQAKKNTMLDKVKDKKLYQDLGENLTFQQSMRNFHTNPITTIPNNQEDFKQFCYGNMPSQKEMHNKSLMQN